jgi:hypothetical protein
VTVASSSAGDKFEGSHATDLRSATPAQSAVTFSTASLFLTASLSTASPNGLGLWVALGVF